MLGIDDASLIHKALVRSDTLLFMYVALSVILPILSPTSNRRVKGKIDGREAHLSREGVSTCMIIQRRVYVSLGAFSEVIRFINLLLFLLL